MKLVVVEGKLAGGYFCEVASALDAHDKVFRVDHVITAHQEGKALTHLEEGLKGRGKEEGA